MQPADCDKAEATGSLIVIDGDSATAVSWLPVACELSATGSVAG
jgi:hypothetical protein